MKGMKRVMPRAAAVAIALGVIAIFAMPSQPALVATTTPEKTVFCARMHDGEEWMISYTHSVNRRPVYDFMRIEGTGFRILRSRYDAFGAGMPETSTPENPLRMGPDGWLEYTVNRPVPDLTVFVGRVAGHELHIRGRTIPFSNLAAPGRSLRFFVDKRPWYRILTGRCIWK